MDISQFAIHSLMLILLITGFFLTVVSLPGNLFLFIIALLYGCYEGFQQFNLTVLATLFGMLVFGEVVEFAAGVVSARKEKASKRAMFAAVIGAVLGGVTGTAILPVIGSVLGASLGAFLASYVAEYTKQTDLAKAGRVAKSVLVGHVVGMLIKIAVGVGMIIVMGSHLPWH